MEKQFVTYQISLKLKELGFNEPCLGYFNIETKELIDKKWNQHPNKSSWTINAPLWQQAIDWFETEKHIIVEEHLYYSYNKQMWGIANSNHPDYENDILTTFFKSKYDARKQAILNAIELCTKKE